MDDLIAKLKNLSYELFGILFPGFIFELFFLLWWVTLGSNASKFTFGLLPEFTVDKASELVNSLTSNTGIGIAIPSLISAYFVGHILHWISRSSSADNATIENSFMRVWHALSFRVLKPNENYYPSLDPLYQAVEKKFRPDESVSFTWQQFFPLAKCYLAENLPSSLVSTYQIKYTLHRSITASAVILFWFSVIELIYGIIYSNICDSSQPFYFGGLTILVLVSLGLVWGFSDSYTYNWRMFGNTIITESYTLLFGPKSDGKKS